MNLVHIDRSGAVLSEENGRIVVRSGGERVATLPLKTIDRLVITSSMSLDTGLLLRLQDRGTGVLIAPEAFRRFTPVNLLPMRTDTQRRQKQYRAAGDPRRSAQTVAGLLRLRLSGQVEVLNGLMDAANLERKAGEAAIATITRLSDRLSALPVQDEARGMEGAAAAAFFNAYRQAFPAALGFVARRRRPPPDPVNVCLSLGYTLAHHEALHALAETGLDPACGFLHEPLAGRDSLACDLVEPLRAIVERFVHGLFHDSGLRPEHFSAKDGACMMGKAGRRLFYEHHAQEAAPQLRRISRSSAAWLVRELGLEELKRLPLLSGESDDEL